MTASRTTFQPAPACLAGFDVQPLAVSDLHRDFDDFVTALGGQVVGLGRDLGTLNPLDTGALGETAQPAISIREVR